MSCRKNRGYQDSYIDKSIIILAYLFITGCEIGSVDYPKSYPKLAEKDGNVCPDLSGYFEDRPQDFTFSKYETRPIGRFGFSLHSALKDQKIKIIKEKYLLKYKKSKNLKISRKENAYEIAVFIDGEYKSDFSLKRGIDFECDEGWLTISWTDPILFGYGVGADTTTFKFTKSENNEYLVSFLHEEGYGVALFFMPAYFDQEYWAYWRDLSRN